MQRSVRLPGSYESYDEQGYFSHSSVKLTMAYPKRARKNEAALLTLRTRCTRNWLESLFLLVAKQFRPRSTAECSHPVTKANTLPADRLP